MKPVEWSHSSSRSETFLFLTNYVVQVEVFVNSTGQNSFKEFTKVDGNGQRSVGYTVVVSLFIRLLDENNSRFFPRPGRSLPAVVENLEKHFSSFVSHLFDH